MPRNLEQGFLREYVTYCSSGTEIPSIFSLWSGVACLSAILGRTSYIDMGHYRIYPNLYIVLVAQSAACHKSAAIKQASRLLRQVRKPINFISQKLTPEALIQSLSEGEVSTAGTMINKHCEGIAISDELSTFIDRNSFQNGMISLLTDLWDCPDKFEYRTRGRGTETITNCYLSIFGGSTAQWIKEAIPIVAIGGGFTSRVLFVYVERPEKLKLFTPMTTDNTARGIKLVQELNQISQLEGAFALTPQAIQFLEQNYQEFHATSDMIDDKNLSGYAGRRYTSLLKLGMLISASERNTKQIHESDLHVALNMLEGIELHLPRVMQAITSEVVGDVCEEVLRFVRQKKIIKRSALMQKFSNRLSSRELSVIVDTLLEMKVVVMDGTADNPTLVYIERKG